MSYGFAKLLVSVKHGCPCVSAPTSLFVCTSLELEREEKEALRTDWQCLASFRTFGVINLTSHNWSFRCPDWSLIESTHERFALTWPDANKPGQWRQWWIASSRTHVNVWHDTTCKLRACRGKHKTHFEKEQVHQPVRTSCGGLAKLLSPRKWERFSINLLDPRQSMRNGFHLHRVMISQTILLILLDFDGVVHQNIFSLLYIFLFVIWSIKTM